jgi:hypothetical protein
MTLVEELGAYQAPIFVKLTRLLANDSTLFYLRLAVRQQLLNFSVRTDIVVRRSQVPLFDGAPILVTVAVRSFATAWIFSATIRRSFRSVYQYDDKHHLGKYRSPPMTPKVFRIRIGFSAEDTFPGHVGPRR